MTTFVDIISGIKFPSEGHIEIDNIKLSQKNIFNWFDKISYVPQRIFLFNDTIKNNILLNCKERITEEQLIKIIGVSYLDEFVDSKSNKLNEIISEGSINLSGGEIQRIGIARALIKKPDILILDETTSGIQIEMERAILKEIKKFLPNITIFLITHRDKSLEFCDEVINFEK